MKRFSILPLIIAALPLVFGGCGFEETGSEVTGYPGYQKRVFHLEAPCQVNVEGVGMVDIDDYIAGVVACENGGAPLEALKAQAVQARSFLFYKFFVAGETVIRNSTSDQVYSCSYRPNGPEAIHYEATEATKGQYLTWNDRIVASFYVAGAIPPNPDPQDPISSCVGTGGNDPTTTEKWVTYNWGKTGCNSSMTPLGWTPADCNDNPHNRGCASQNGEACLAELGWHYQDMLRYYYGDDIVLTNSDGACGGPPPMEIDDHDRFCGPKPDGNYCQDAATAVTCAGSYAAEVAECVNGCVDGACTGDVGMSPCDGLADGSHCVNGQERIECASGELSLSEMCADGCTDGVCVIDQSNGDDSNNGDGRNNDSNDDGMGAGGDIDDEGSSPGTDFPALVDVSRGQSGGCSTAETGPFSPFALLLLALFALFGQRRAR